MSDNGQGLGKTDTDETANHARERIGLSNTRQRLQTLYGDGHSFELVENPSGGVTANIIIPFRLAHAAG